MKLIYGCWLILIIALAACRKSDAENKPEKQKPISSIQETYLGVTTTYFLTYNDVGQLSAYESEDKKFKAEYRYERRKPQWIRFKKDTVTYELRLPYDTNGVPGNGTLTIILKSGKVIEEPIVVTKTADEIKLSFFNNLYTCLIRDENLISASFNAWYFKRTINIAYGADPGCTFGTNTIVPKGEMNNPLTPDSDLYTSIFHMLLSAFSKNNVLSMNSGLYTRSFQYTKDERGRVSSSTIQISKKVEDGNQVLDSKRITYRY